MLERVEWVGLPATSKQRLPAHCSDGPMGTSPQYLHRTDDAPRGVLHSLYPKQDSKIVWNTLLKLCGLPAGCDGRRINVLTVGRRRCQVPLRRSRAPGCACPLAQALEDRKVLRRLHVATVERGEAGFAGGGDTHGRETRTALLRSLGKHGIDATAATLAT